MEKLKVGFVGVGWMGQTLLKRLAERRDVEVLAVFEPNAQQGREVLGQLGLPANLLVDDFARLTDNPAVDSVWVVSPNGFHGAQTIQALLAGKHVFCEKPAATEFADYLEQIALEKANPRLITMVDYILYFDTMETLLRRMAAEGQFGKITQIQVNYRHPINIAGSKAWKLDRRIMGDAIGMGVVHGLSAMVYIMAAQAKPVEVYAINMPAQVRAFEAEPIWNILLRFDNGATGFCFGNIDSGNGYDAAHNLYGTEGAFMFDSFADRPAKVRYWSNRSTNGQWVWPLDAQRCAEAGFASLAWPADATTPDSGDVMQHQTAATVDHFVQCARTGVKSPLSFVNSAPIAEIGWAAQMSAAMHRPVALPLDEAQARAFFAGQGRHGK